MIEKPANCRGHTRVSYSARSVRYVKVWPLLVLVSACSPWLALAAVAPAAAQVVRAPQAVRTSIVRFSSLGWTNQTVSGPSPSLDLYIPGPGDVSLGDHTTLTISYSRSGLLDGKHSFVAISINNVNIGGHVLVDGFHRPATFRLTVPANLLLSNGFNHLQLNFNLRDQLSATPMCGNTDPALSATIYGTSMLHYDVRRTTSSAFTPNLAMLPAPFVQPGASVPPHLLVSLPSRPSSAELTDAGWILARFGADGASAPPTVSALADAALSAGTASANGASLLLVGTAGDNPAIGRIAVDAPIRLHDRLWRDAEDRPLPPTEGVILEARSPWNTSRAVLIASGNGQEAVRRAALVLASATLRRLLNGTYATLGTPPIVPATPPISSMSTLRNLGYNSVTLEGSGELSWHLNFDLQGSPTHAGEFSLVFGHGSLPADAASSVRVDLNDQPIASRPLRTDDPIRQQWRMPLPIDALKAGTNVLNVRFFLAPLQPGCQTVTNLGLWATIDASSTLTRPETD